MEEHKMMLSGNPVCIHEEVHAIVIDLGKCYSGEDEGEFENVWQHGLSTWMNMLLEKSSWSKISIYPFIETRNILSQILNDLAEVGAFSRDINIEWRVLRNTDSAKETIE